MTEDPNDWLREPLSTFRVIVSHGVTITPEWYDFPRRLGWRAKKHESILDMRGCEVVIDYSHKIIYASAAMEQTLRRALPERYFASPR